MSDPPQTTRKQPRVKPLRLLLLFIIVNAGIVVAALLLMVFATALPTLQAFAWHLHNGNKFVIEGHTFHVPVRWDVNLTHYKEWELSEDHPISGGSSYISLSSGGEVRDAAAIDRLTSIRMTAPQLPPLFTMSTETIHGKQLTFVCTRMDMHQFGETLSCNVPNTDLAVLASASANYVTQVRTILESSE